MGEREYVLYYTHIRIPPISHVHNKQIMYCRTQMILVMCKNHACDEEFNICARMSVVLWVFNFPDMRFSSLSWLGGGKLYGAYMPIYHCVLYELTFLSTRHKISA